MKTIESGQEMIKQTVNDELRQKKIALHLC